MVDRLRDGISIMGLDLHDTSLSGDEAKNNRTGAGKIEKAQGVCVKTVPVGRWHITWDGKRSGEKGFCGRRKKEKGFRGPQHSSTLPSRHYSTIVGSETTSTSDTGTPSPWNADASLLSVGKSLARISSPATACTSASNSKSARENLPRKRQGGGRVPSPKTLSSASKPRKKEKMTNRIIHCIRRTGRFSGLRLPLLPWYMAHCLHCACWYRQMRHTALEAVCRFHYKRRLRNLSQVRRIFTRKRTTENPSLYHSFSPFLSHLAQQCPSISLAKSTLFIAQWIHHRLRRRTRKMRMPLLIPKTSWTTQLWQHSCKSGLTSLPRDHRRESAPVLPHDHHRKFAPSRNLLLLDLASLLHHLLSDMAMFTSLRTVQAARKAPRM